MLRIFLSALLFVFSCGVQAQYTETINSNRPGYSHGAFSVGRDILQFEVGPHFGQTQHEITNLEADIYGLRYEIRYGVWKEQFEINLKGDFVHANRHYTVGGVEQSSSFSNFRTNTLGVKYLVYDPSRAHYFDKPNVYSWKANHRVQWWMLIPAVSIYAGVNMTFGDRPAGYPFYGDQLGNVSPKVALITQHNLGPFVFVMNFIADRLTDDHKRYVGIFTLTHAINRRFSIFGEYQAVKDDFYSDDIARAGAAYLISRNFQVDLAGLINFKDTPSRWQVGVGVSYRIDMHSENELIIKKKKQQQLPGVNDKKKKEGEKQGVDPNDPAGIK